MHHGFDIRAYRWKQASPSINYGSVYNLGGKNELWAVILYSRRSLHILWRGEVTERFKEFYDIVTWQHTSKNFLTLWSGSTLQRFCGVMKRQHTFMTLWSGSTLQRFCGVMKRQHTFMTVWSGSTLQIISWRCEAAAHFK